MSSTQLPSPQAIDAFLNSDLEAPDALPTTVRGYRRDEVHGWLVALRRQVSVLNAELEDALAVQERAKEIVLEAELVASETLADAMIESRRARCEPSGSVVSNQRIVDKVETPLESVKDDVNEGDEMAVSDEELIEEFADAKAEQMRSYSDQHPHRFDNGAEQDAFDRFFGGDKSKISRRDWMRAS